MQKKESEKSQPQGQDQTANKTGQNNNLHAGHRQRMKQAFYENGLASMQPHQVLEMLLYQTIPYVDTNEIAHRLLSHFGSFSAVLDAPTDALLQVEGIKPASAFLINLLPQLARYYYEDKEKSGEKVTCMEDARRLLAPKFFGRSNEVVALLILNSNLKAALCSVIFEGSINSAPIYVRKIIDLCIRHNADSIVIAHNHPSSSVMPSKGDLTSTRLLISALQTIDVKLYDHLIFGGDDCLSMVHSGWMEYLLQEIEENTRKEGSLSQKAEEYLFEQGGGQLNAVQSRFEAYRSKCDAEIEKFERGEAFDAQYLAQPSRDENENENKGKK